MYEEITGQARQAVTELLEAARLEPGDLFVVGCSSSEVGGRGLVPIPALPWRKPYSRAFIPC